MNFCRYCGFPQIQFEKPRHADHCIVRQIRAALKISQEHWPWRRWRHNLWEVDLFDRGRDRQRLRAGLAWLEREVRKR